MRADLVLPRAMERCGFDCPTSISTTRTVRSSCQASWEERWNSKE